MLLTTLLLTVGALRPADAKPISSIHARAGFVQHAKARVCRRRICASQSDHNEPPLSRTPARESRKPGAGRWVSLGVLLGLGTFIQDAHAQWAGDDGGAVSPWALLEEQAESVLRGLRSPESIAEDVQGTLKQLAWVQVRLDQIMSQLRQEGPPSEEMLKAAKATVDAARVLSTKLDQALQDANLDSLELWARWSGILRDLQTTRESLSMPSSATRSFTLPTLPSLPPELNGRLQEALAGLAQALDPVIAQLSDYANRASESMSGPTLAIGERVTWLQQTMDDRLGGPLAFQLLVAVFVTFLAFQVDALLFGTDTGEEQGATLGDGSYRGGPPRVYDVRALRKYYKARSNTVLARVLSVLAQSSGFVSGLLLDYTTKNDRDEERAKQAKTLITDLGPIFIKVGQLISVRPDIVKPAYLKELQTLQDQVRPFSSKEALEIIQSQLPPGIKVEDVFSDLRAFDEPVAAASLGQVYKARLTTGEEVAVKVQRPGLLEAVTLDLYTIRLVFSLGARIEPFRESCEGIIGVLDNWGNRFLQELDYLQEATNAKLFARAMAKSPVVASAIVVPETFDEFTTRYVLVSKWIDGQRLSSLDRTDPVDRERLSTVVAVLINSYLVQLLETGLLHSDPHPGNFLLTPEGKLCILDYGLMTEITPEQSTSLVEYVAHLTAKDYDATVLDLVRLGFIPQEVADDPAKRNIVAPILGHVLEQLSNGGGAKAVNVEEIGAQVEALADQYPLTIPSWFGLIVRTFSALEGLGLSLDDGYSIVKQCYPYLARRMITDDSPRIRAALKAFLYGADKQLKVERVNEMVEAYRSFSLAFEELQQQNALPQYAAAASSYAAATGYSPRATLQRPQQSRDYLDFDESTVEALKVIFARDGNYVQELLVDELVRMTDAAGKELTGLVARNIKGAQRLLSPRSLFRNPLSGVLLLPLLPLVTTLAVFSAIADRAESLSQLTEEDRESLKTLRRLLGLVQASVSNTPLAPFVVNPGLSTNSNEGLYDGGSTATQTTVTRMPFFAPALPPREAIQAAVGLSSRLGVLVPDIAPGAAVIGRRFLRRLTSRVLTRLADELEAGPPPPASSYTSPTARTYTTTTTDVSSVITR